MAAYLAKIGTSDPVEPRLTLGELASEFDFAKIGRAPAHFVPEELAALNAKTLHAMPYSAVAASVPQGEAVLGRASSPISASAATLPKWHGWSAAR